MTTFAQRVRDVMQKQLSGRDFSHKDVALHMDLVTDKEKQPLYDTMRDFKKRGEITVVSPGVFRYARGITIRPAEVQRKMWSLVRSMRTVNIEDMVALSGASENYAREFLQMLGRQGIVRRIDMPGNKPCKWQLIVDPIKMPRNGDKAAKLRKLRVAKKNALECVEMASGAIDRLKTVLEDLDVTEDA